MMRPLDNIQVLRALAALSVILFHVQGELAHRGFDDPFPDLALGAIGVDIFFVISGFIMVYASTRSFAAPGAGRLFLVRRITRIVPLYWSVSVVSVAVALVLARSPDHVAPTLKHILASFLFIPAARPEDGAVLPICPLGWTLDYEMFFYLCFAAALRWRRGPAISAVATALIALVLAGALVPLPWPLAYWAQSITLDFAAGMLLARIRLSGWRLGAPVALGLAAACLAAAWLFVPSIDAAQAWRGLFWGVPATGIVAAGALTDTPRSGPIKRALVRLGDASYSLYLAHTALFIGLYLGIARWIGLDRFSAPGYAALLLVASVATGLAIHAGFEEPVTRALNRRLVPAAAAVLPPAAEPVA